MESAVFIKAGMSIDNYEAVALMNARNLALKYGAIILTDMFDSDLVEDFILLDSVFDKEK